MDPDEVRERWRRAAARAAAATRSTASPGRLPGDVPPFFGSPLAVVAADLLGADVAVLGIPYDGRSSEADDAPAAIRRHSAPRSLGRHEGSLDGPDPDLAALDRLRIVDYGDVVVDPRDVAATFLQAHEKLADIFAAGAAPAVLGGDHAVSIPVLQVLAATLTGKLGVVVFDAHLDLDLEPRYAAGSQWARVFELGVVEPANFVQIGIHGADQSAASGSVAAELGHRYYTVAEVDEAGMATVAQEALELAAAGTEAIYISLDLDALDPIYGGQKHPEAAGLSARELLAALRTLATGRVAGFDVCGLAPRQDLQGNLGRLAARAALEVVAGLALQRP